jgi:hypothetical protein
MHRILKMPFINNPKRLSPTGREIAYARWSVPKWEVMQKNPPINPDRTLYRLLGSNFNQLHSFYHFTHAKTFSYRYASGFWWCKCTTIYPAKKRLDHKHFVCNWIVSGRSNYTINRYLVPVRMRVSSKDSA